MKKYLILLLITVNIFQSSEVIAQAGILDPTFGNGGKVIVMGSRTLNGMIVQPDGKLVAAGAYLDSSTLSLILMITRYNSNGIIDSSFGKNGIDSFKALGSEAQSLVLQTDGKIVVAGYINNQNLAVFRYNTNGSLDSSFGTNGLQSITDRLPLGSYAFTIALQNDGKIVAGGTCNDPGGADNPSGMLLVRLNTNGNLDSSFGNNGLDTVRGLYGQINAITIQSDGKIIGTGAFADSVQGETPIAARYNTNGTLDSSFGTNGIDTSAPSIMIRTANGAALQNDGKIVVAGYGSINNTYDNFTLVRYNIDGTVDNTFGIPTLSIYGENSNAYALALENDGKIIIAGATNANTGNSQPSSFAMARYLPTGIIDSSFGINGIDTTYITNTFPPFAYQIAYSIQLTHSRIYLAGTDGVNGAIAAYANDENSLPITNLTFNAILHSSIADLTWGTSSEINNKGFEVQKSMDGQNFTDLGFVKGHGNSINVNKYNYTDAKILHGLNYYRLKQINNDGHFTYSPIRSVNFTAPTDFSFYPNPAKSEINLSISNQTGIAVITLMDMNGNKLQQINKSVQQGSIVNINISNLSAGTYLINVIINGINAVQKLVKE